MRVLAFASSTSCQSGTLVVVRSDRLRKNFTLDSHWLTFVSRPIKPTDAWWDDDIPFNRASCHSTKNGKRLLISVNFAKEIYFGKHM